MMPLDNFLPEFETVERHAISILASPEQVYQSLLTIDFNQSRIINLLFSLRGLQSLAKQTKPGQPKTIRLVNFTNIGFILLVDDPARELILGLIGRFWTLRGGLVSVAASEFSTYPASRNAKAVWGFKFEELGKLQTRLVTETRVHVPDRSNRGRFALYWRLIGPFSGLIRRELLQLVKRQAEILATI
jgi:hypothetical protein